MDINTDKKLKKYLLSKDAEIMLGSEENNDLVFIPYNQTETVRKYLSKNQYNYSVRFNHDYSLSILSNIFK